MQLKDQYLAEQVVKSYKDYEKDSAGIYSFTEWGWINTMMMNGGFLRVALGDAGLKVKGEGGINKRLSQYDNSKHLETDRVPIGQWIDPVGFKRDYDIQKDLDKIAKRLYFNGKAKELWEFAIPEQIRRDYLKSGLNPKKIVDYAYRKINEVISKKNPINIRNNVELRKLQKLILVKMMKMLERHGIDSTLVAELAPRIGKTILFLALFDMMNKVYGHKVMMIFGYGVGLSIFKSYKDEINSYRDFNSKMEYIDIRQKNAERIFKKTVKGNKKLAVVMISLNTKTHNLPKYLADYMDPVFALLEEGDFGCHTFKQIPKVELLLKNKKTFRVNASGTNIGRLARAFGTTTINEVLTVPYSMVEQDKSLKNRVLRKYFNMTFDDSVNKHLKDWNPEYLPSISKIFKKPLAQKLWIEEVGRSIYDYAPEYGLSMDQQAGEQIFGSMVFGNFEKIPMHQLQKIWSKVLPEHYIEVLNGDTTTTREAQDLIERRINEIKQGFHKGKRKLIVITNMIGSRSFTVPEIKACLMFQDNGAVGAWIQKTSRCLSPMDGKGFGYIFDFNMDPNKVRNSEMSLIYDAKARSDLTGKSFIESLREVMNSASLKDVFKGKWLNSQDLLKRIEDSNKLLDVADNSTHIDIGELSSLEIDLLLSIKGSLSSKKLKKLKKLITGKTFKNINGKNKKSLQNTLVEAIRKAISRINSSATTVSDFVKGASTSYSGCIDIIANDPELDNQFLEMYGITASNLKQLLYRLPLGILDICIYNSKHGFSQKHLINKELGILGEQDDPKLWNRIISQAVLDARIRYTLKNNGKILIVAGGHGTEVDVLVERYGKGIIKYIWFNDKYECFTNRIKRKYNKINILKGNFLSLNIDMKFDVILGNPPYQDSVNPTTKLWNRFLEKAVGLCKDDGVVGFITPGVWLIRPKGQASKRIVNTILSKYQLLEIDTTANDYFEVGERICSYIIKKSKKNVKTKLIKKDQTVDIDYNGQVIPIDKNDELKIAIFDKIESYPDTLRNLTYNDTSSSADEKTGARARMSKKKNKNQVNVYWTASSTNDHFQDKEKIKKGPKVILNRSGYYYKDEYPDKYIKLDMNEEYAIGVGAFGISVKDKAEGIRLKKLLISKLYRWYIENEKSGGFNTGINKLPLLSLDSEWTDKKLYKKFNLSDKEVKFVEDYFKSN